MPWQPGLATLFKYGLFDSNWPNKGSNYRGIFEMARFSPGPVRRYRWKELGLFIVLFMILVLEMIQLPIAQYYQSKIQTNQLSIPFSTALLPSFRDLIPVFGLIAALVGMNLLLSVFFSRSDQILLPLAG